MPAAMHHESPPRHPPLRFPPERRKMKRSWLLWVVLVALIGAGIMWLMGRKSAAEDERNLNAPAGSMLPSGSSLQGVEPAEP
jgi:hypothetical protein